MIRTVVITGTGAIDRGARSRASSTCGLTGRSPAVRCCSRSSLGCDLQRRWLVTTAEQHLVGRARDQATDRCGDDEQPQLADRTPPREERGTDGTGRVHEVLSIGIETMWIKVRT